MNKGIALADGEWICFMNAGDSFHDAESIAGFSDSFNTPGTDFIYSDVELRFGSIKSSAGLYACDHKRRLLIHQGVIYKKSLHDKYGKYLVGGNITISDYLFFCLLPDSAFFKKTKPLAIYDCEGTSNSTWAVEQKFLVDRLTGRIEKSELIIKIILYPFWRKLRHWLRKRRALKHSKLRIL